MHQDELLKLLKNQVLIADGAMGTLLYKRGVFINTCFDEINISKPDLVSKIHKEYIEAGADIIETNTFGANHIKLSKFGLGDKTEKINKEAVRLAAQYKTENTIIAGAIGPSGVDYKYLPEEKKKDVCEKLSQQAEYLIDAGADVLILETFSDSLELISLLKSICKKSNIAIITQATFNEDHETSLGEPAPEVIRSLSKENSTVVGANCSVGPSTMLDILKTIKKSTDKPISIQPNAGLPQRVENRTLYMCTPEYMAEYSKRFFENGVRIIGGCCGTEPRHIKEIAKTIKPLTKTEPQKEKKTKINIQPEVKEIHLKKEKPVSEISHIGKKLSNKKKVLSIEISPPKGVELDKTLQKAKKCKEAGIDAINIPDGPRASSRLSAMVTSVKIQQHAGIESILHFCCRDKSLLGMQSDLLGAAVMGIKNVLVVTGDPPKLGDYPHSTGVFDLDSVELTRVLKRMNQGVDVAGNEIGNWPGLTLGVGANPVADNLEREIERFKMKVDAGAQYAITQPVFDKEMLLEFMDKTSDHKIPIIAGVWPFVSYKNAEFMANEVPGVVVPDKYLEKMKKTTTKQEGIKLGIEIAQEIIEEISYHVQGFAVSAPFGKIDIALEVLGK